MTDESKGRFALQEGIGYFIRRILYIGFNCSYHDAVTKPCFLSLSAGIGQVSYSLFEQFYYKGMNNAVCCPYP